VLGGVLFAVLFGLEATPADLSSTPTPLQSIVMDRGAFRILALVAGAALGLLLGAVLGLTMGAAEDVGPPRLEQAGGPDLVRILEPTVQPTIEPTVAVYWAYVGVVVGLGMGVVISLARSAWGTYVLGRCYLALTGRAPWRLFRFLRDAHAHRGVLRQAGPVYQFRHLELQRRLADLEYMGAPVTPDRPEPAGGAAGG
jgi:hypothetical protein